MSKLDKKTQGKVNTIVLQIPEGGDCEAQISN